MSETTIQPNPVKSALGLLAKRKTEQPGAAPVQIDLEEAIAKPAKKRAGGKSSQEGYERLTVYVRKKTKEDLERSLIGSGQDMSDKVQELLDSHLGV